jgi:hypothetical protein
MRSTRLKRKSTKTIIRDFFRNAEKEKKGERKERRKKKVQPIGRRFDNCRNMTTTIDRPVGLPSLHTRNLG